MDQGFARSEPVLAVKAERYSLPDLKSICPQKLYFLKEYVDFLSAHNNDVSEYSKLIIAGVDGDHRNGVKNRVEESLHRYHEARKKYVDHLREHGCDDPE